MQSLYWLAGYARDELEVFVEMKQRCTDEFSVGGYQEIRHRGRLVKPLLGLSLQERTCTFVPGTLHALQRVPTDRTSVTGC